MEPTIIQGETVLVSKIPFLFSKPKIGDIVAFKMNYRNRHSGKRGTSASRISSQSLQRVRRFWTSQNDEGEKFFIKRIAKIDTSSDGEKYFVKGDNEKDSLDSRRFGWIERKDILGKVVYRTS